MRVNVRHEAAIEASEDTEAAPERSCVWVVGEDGETIDTRYLAPGEETSFDFGVQETTSAAAETEEPQQFGKHHGLGADKTSAAASQVGREADSARAEEPPAS